MAEWKDDDRQKALYSKNLIGSDTSEKNKAIAYYEHFEPVYIRTLNAMQVGGEKPRFHQDHRRMGWFDVFPTTLNSDINIVKIPKGGTITGWHRHKHQIDMWFVPQGLLQVGVMSPDKQKVQWYFLSPEEGKALWIPPHHWHGYKALQDNTMLIYCLTNKYDGTDEERLSIEDAGIDWNLGAK